MTTRPRIRRRGAGRGFTLIELLVVILIIGLISVVALPTILPALNHRQVSEAGRLLQGALVGARDKAIHTGQPSGIRLLPDPAFPINWLVGSSGNAVVNPYSILAYNRVVPIDPAPEYSEGKCTPTLANTVTYSGATLVTPGFITAQYPHALLLIESPAQPNPIAGNAPVPNPPTSWFWNIRVGDKIQLNSSGAWYTIVGPMTIGPQGNGTIGNPEMFVNVGPPGPMSTSSGLYPVLTFPYGTSTQQLPVEYLILVNGQDDNGNGWVDEGFDGIDNDGDNAGNANSPTNPSFSLIDEYTCAISPGYGEWESEAWLGSIGPDIAAGTAGDMLYTIRRRPMPSTNAREIALPTDMVIDATTLFTTRERSRLPNDLQSRVSGYIDILINPDGTVVPTTLYSAPSIYSMDQAFYHFWLGERQDVTAPNTSATAPPYLPIAQPGGSNASSYSGPFLKGDYAVVSLNGRTGQLSSNANPPFFLDPTFGYTNNPSSNAVYNPVYPFIQAEQGVNGGP